MKSLPILQIDEDSSNPLRFIAKEITQKEFKSKELQETIQHMKDTLAKEEDGVALAAPQVGISKRMFVVSPLAYREDAKWKPLVFINPRIVKASKKMKSVQEGCLYVRWIYGTTERAVSVTVEAKDENGVTFTFGASDLLAHIFQHEIDHLDGILFIDHGHDFEEFTEAEVKASSKKKS
jgi:peptide deformylase